MEGGEGRTAKVRESKREEREKKSTPSDETGRRRGDTQRGLARGERQRIAGAKKKESERTHRGGRREKRIEFGANRVIRWKPPAVS